jgi:protease-4
VAGPLRPVIVEQGQAGRVAVIDVDGLLLNTPFVGPMSLGENPVALFREKLAAAEADPCVKSVVIRINSHGGGVEACILMRRDLEKFKARTGKPVVACLLDTACGGAYYLASACDQVVAGEATVTGGIGVILNLFNLQDLMAQFNILGIPVKSGANIDLGSPVKEISPEKRKLLQDMADEFHARFRNVVVKARPEVDGSLETTFDGRVFTARQAKDLRLVDQIGYLDNAVAMVRTMAGVDYANVVFYHRRDDPAMSPYSITPNTPLQKGLIPFSVPGLDRSKLPSFLYLWQMDPTIESAIGK